jgi:hypothetical protein
MNDFFFHGLVKSQPERDRETAYFPPIYLSFCEFNRLRSPTGWLTDDIIRAASLMIQTMLDGNLLFFVDPLLFQCKKSLSRPTIDKNKNVFMPRHLPSAKHWILVFYQLSTNTLKIYDSLESDKSEIDEAIALLKEEFPSDCSVSVEECPKQTNGSDCGMFVIANMYRLAVYECNKEDPDSCELSFGQADIAMLRNQLADTLISFSDKFTPLQYPYWREISQKDPILEKGVGLLGQFSGPHFISPDQLEYYQSDVIPQEIIESRAFITTEDQFKFAEINCQFGYQHHYFPLLALISKTVESKGKEQERKIMVFSGIRRLALWKASGDQSALLTVYIHSDSLSQDDIFLLRKFDNTFSNNINKGIKRSWSIKEKLLSFISLLPEQSKGPFHPETIEIVENLVKSLLVKREWKLMRYYSVPFLRFLATKAPKDVKSMVAFLRQLFGATWGSMNWAFIQVGSLEKQKKVTLAIDKATRAQNLFDLNFFLTLQNSIEQKLLTELPFIEKNPSLSHEWKDFLRHSAALFHQEIYVLIEQDRQTIEKLELEHPNQREAPNLDSEIEILETESESIAAMTTPQMVFFKQQLIPRISWKKLFSLPILSFCPLGDSLFQDSSTSQSERGLEASKSIGGQQQGLQKTEQGPDIDIRATQKPKVGAEKPLRKSKMNPENFEADLLPHGKSFEDQCRAVQQTFERVLPPNKKLTIKSTKKMLTVCSTAERQLVGHLNFEQLFQSRIKSLIDQALFSKSTDVLHILNNAAHSLLQYHQLEIPDTSKMPNFQSHSLTQTAKKDLSQIETAERSCAKSLSTSIASSTSKIVPKQDQVASTGGTKPKGDLPPCEPKFRMVSKPETPAKKPSTGEPSSKFSPSSPQSQRKITFSSLAPSLPSSSLADLESSPPLSTKDNRKHLIIVDAPKLQKKKQRTEIKAII